MSQPRALLLYGSYCAGTLFMAVVLLIAVDALLTRTISAFLKGRFLRPFCLFAVPFLIIVLGVIFGENLPEKLSRYPQFFFKTAVGTPVMGFLIVWPYFEISRQREGKDPLLLKSTLLFWAWIAGSLTLCLFCDISWRPEQYFTIHLLFKSAVLFNLLMAVDRVFASRLSRPFCIAALCCFIGFASVPVAFANANQSAKSVFYSRSVFAAPAMRLIHAMLDADGDGAASVFGGADPDDRDALVKLTHLEVPGNGIDDNGLAGDVPAASSHDEKPAVIAAASAPLNVIILTVCSFRHSELSLYGAKMDTTPHISKLAEESVVFDNAYTGFPKTIMGTGGVLTGRFAKRLLNRDHGHADVPTYVTLLSGIGFNTVCIMPTAFFRPHLFWGQGFDVFENSLATAAEHNSKNSVTSALISEKIKEVLPSLKQPFLLQTLFLDGHDNYIQHAEHDFGGNSDEERHRSEIALVDEHIGRVINAIKEAGLWEKTVIALVGDHGEEFGDHGGLSHGEKIYEELVRVPWLIRVPGITPRRVAENVSTVSFLPTLFDALEVKTNTTYDAPTLWPLVKGDSQELSKEIYLEGEGWRGYRDERYKLLFNVFFDYYELYDLEKDPGERRNLADLQPQRFSRMRHRLHELIDKNTTPLPE